MSDDTKVTTEEKIDRKVTEEPAEGSAAEAGGSETPAEEPADAAAEQD